MSAAAEASERAVFDDDEDDGVDDTDADDTDFDDDDTDAEDDRGPPAPPQPPPPAVPTPVPIQPPAPLNGAVQPFSEPKIEERRALVPFPDDSRRLFQRLWTDDDEIKILRGFLEFTTQRGTTFASHQYDTGPFYERIKRELQLDFSKNQLIEKLRRLKKKFRNAAARIAAGKESVFKSPHDQATFEISRKIWSAGLKNGRDSDDDDLHTPHTVSAAVDPVDTGGSRTSSRSRRRRVRRRIEETAVEVPVAGMAVDDPAKVLLALPPPVAPVVTLGPGPGPAPVPIPVPVPVPNLIEETVKGCVGPLFKELLSSVVGAPSAGLGLTFGGLALNSLLPLGSGGSLLNPPPLGTGTAGNDKWRKQQILELEVYSKRIELLQEQIKSTLEELKASSTATGS